MATINHPVPQRRKDRPFYFSKPEFTAIIAAYSLRVATALNGVTMRLIIRPKLPFSRFSKAVMKPRFL